MYVARLAPPGFARQVLDHLEATAREVLVSKESERIPTVTPSPSTSKALRADDAPSCVSPSEVTRPWQLLEATIGARTGLTPSTPARAPSLGKFPGAVKAATVRYSPLTWATEAPAAASSAAPPEGSNPSAKRTLTRTWLPRRTRLPGPVRGRLRRASCTRCGAPRTAGLTNSERRADSSGFRAGPARPARSRASAPWRGLLERARTAPHVGGALSLAASLVKGIGCHHPHHKP